MITVDQVAALARDPSMLSSYKPALLKTLVRIVRGGATSPISPLHIGHEFVNLYWVQTVVFRLRQAVTIIAEPEVVRRIRSTSDLSGVRRLTELPADTRQRLDGEMARVLTINVLDRFHKSAPNGMPRLYDWHPGDDFISIDDETLAFLRRNRQALETIANYWCALYLERINILAPLIIEKVERNGAQRGSLAKYLKILRVTDRTHCFYCERHVGDGETPHVDHVIPWSFLHSDPLWDLVLSCASCNLAESNVLPDRRFLDKLAAAAVDRGKRMLPVGVGSPLITRDELDRYYSAALSVEWPSGWIPAA